MNRTFLLWEEPDISKVGGQGIVQALITGVFLQ